MVEQCQNLVNSICSFHAHNEFHILGDAKTSSRAKYERYSTYILPICLNINVALSILLLLTVDNVQLWASMLNHPRPTADTSSLRLLDQATLHLREVCSTSSFSCQKSTQWYHQKSSLGRRSITPTLTSQVRNSTPNSKFLSGEVQTILLLA